MESKRAILVISFGSSIEEARLKAIQPIEELIKESFPNYQVERAFTSNKIIKKLKETKGLFFDTPEEGLQKLIKKGFQEIILQPLHIIPGFEFDKIKKTIMDNRSPSVEIRLGKPLLYDKIDYLKVMEALQTQLPTIKGKQVVLFIGHGTNHQANEHYYALQTFLKEQGHPIIVSTLEADMDQVMMQLKEGGYTEVVLMPFLLVAGDHVQNDLLGEDEYSWKSRLTSSGYLVKAYPKGLGENPAFQALYLQRVQELIVR
ncbi:MAG: sirohydrochlorin cobaltochelatase [Firmicutes bacterium HGW-Firmicutes-7]|nr:MAG: sirohydrochlorin cobaltochelatase [Firmicutes bacterium HGW-Firmicutes-7]